MRTSALELATQAWEDAQLRSGALDLLASDPAHLGALKDEYVDGCLMDLQLLLESAWERGEIGRESAQLQFP